MQHLSVPGIQRHVQSSPCQYLQLPRPDQKLSYQSLQKTTWTPKSDGVRYIFTVQYFQFSELLSKAVCGHHDDNNTTHTIIVVIFYLKFIHNHHPASDTKEKQYTQTIVFARQRHCCNRLPGISTQVRQEHTE